jgi:DHA2 family multidrug resistance protein-like MFS transporter
MLALRPQWLSWLRFAQTEVHVDGEGVPPAERWKAMLAVMLGVCMSSLDTAIANTALPTMALDLHTTEARSVWIVSAYQLAMAASLLPMARWGEVVGHRRLVVAGLALFTVSSLVCGLAPSLGWLVAARMAQGVGGAAMMSVNAAMVRLIFPFRHLGRGLGVNALVVGFSFAAGPAIASLILSLGDWPWLFWVNVPIGLAALALGRAALPRNAAHSQHPLDLGAALLCAAFFALLILLLNEAAHARGWPMLLIEAALTAAALLALLRRQAGMQAPLLPLDLLRRPLFGLSTATAIGSFATQGLAFVSLPFLFQQALGYTQVQTGFLMTPWPVLTALMAPVAGRLSDRHPAGLLGGVGLAMLCLGMVALALLPSHPSVLDVGWRMCLCGAGFGFFQSPNLRALMTSAPPERSGSASGMVSAARMMGQASGAALVAACLHVSTSHGARAALWLGVATAALACAASFSRLRYGAGAVQ